MNKDILVLGLWGKKTFFFSLFWIGVMVVFSMTSCGRGEPAFREYVDTTTQGRFGATDNSSGNISSGEIDLFNRITSPRSLSSGITWETPRSWKEVKETGVRLVSFQTRNSLEVTLVAFPGNVGGIQANLFRWLGQIQVNLSEAELKEFIVGLEVGKSETGDGGLPYVLVDFESYSRIAEQNQPQTIMAAIFGFSDQMLFVKLLGDKKAVAADREDFLGFIKTIGSKSI